MKSIIGLFSVVLILSQCAEEDKKENIKTVAADQLIVKDTTHILSSNSQKGAHEDNPTASGPFQNTALAITNFEDNVFPLLAQNCGQCHGTISPQFAQSDLLASFEALMNSGAVNFQSIPDSRIVKRLTEQSHNCWTDCEHDGSALAAALSAWSESSQVNSVSNDPMIRITTAAQALAAVPAKNSIVESPDGPAYIFIDAEDGTVTQPMQVVVDPDAFGGQYVMPTQGGMLAAADQVVLHPEWGRITIEFSVPESANNWALYGRMQTSGLESDSFFMRIDDGEYFIWDYRNLEPGWHWERVQARTDPARRETARPRNFNLAAGKHTLEIVQRGDSIKLDSLLLSRTGNIDFATTTVHKPTTTLIYDIGSIIPGSEGIFTIQIEDYNSKSYRLVAPSLGTSGVAIRIKNIRPMLNGFYSNQNATYTKIDAVVSTQRNVLSDASLIVLKEKGLGEDTLTIGFEILQPAEN